jgi:hypothetical protein
MMKLIWTNSIFTLFLLFGCFFPPSAKSENQNDIKTQPTKVITRIGNYESSSGRCPIALITSEMGGFLQLVLPVQGEKRHIVDDVTGAGYLSDNLLVYTVSPIYGKPGVYIYDCLSGNVKRIVSPKTKNNGYPYGADYYELQGWRDNRVLFYYTPDVDSTDFEKFRNDSSLYEVHLDGSGFKSVQQERSIGK